MSNEFDVIKIEGTEIERTVGEVAVDLGLLTEMEIELKEFSGGISDKIETKAFEHEAYAKTLLKEFTDSLTEDQQKIMAEVDERIAQHRINTEASIESINEGVAPERKRLADQIEAQRENIKPLVLAYAKTIKGTGMMAVFSKGKSKVDLDPFEKHIKSLIKADEFAQAKFFTEMITDGKPSVAFRKVKLSEVK